MPALIKKPIAVIDEQLRQELTELFKLGKKSRIAARLAPILHSEAKKSPTATAHLNKPKLTRSGAPEYTQPLSKSASAAGSPPPHRISTEALDDILAQLEEALQEDDLSEGKLWSALRIAALLAGQKVDPGALTQPKPNEINQRAITKVNTTAPAAGAPPERKKQSGFKRFQSR